MRNYISHLLIATILVHAAISGGSVPKAKTPVVVKTTTKAKRTIVAPKIATSSGTILSAQAGNGGDGGKAVSYKGNAIGGNGGHGGNNNAIIVDQGCNAACQKAKALYLKGGNGGKGGPAESVWGHVKGGNGGNGGSNFAQIKGNGNAGSTIVASAGDGGDGAWAKSVFGVAVGGGGGLGGNNNIDSRIYTQWHRKNWNNYGAVKPCRCCRNTKEKVWLWAGNGGKGGNATSTFNNAIAGDGGDGGNNFYSAAIYSPCCCKQTTGYGCGYNKRMKSYGYGCGCKFYWKNFLYMKKNKKHWY